MTCRTTWIIGPALLTLAMSWAVPLRGEQNVLPAGPVPYKVEQQAEPAEPAAATDSADTPPAEAPPSTPKEPALNRASVLTIQGKQLEGQITAIRNGSLVLDGEASQEIPMQEIKSIEIGDTPAIRLVWVGQDGHDLAQVGAAQGGNGVQDIHLRVLHLPKDRTITQIIAECPYSKNKMTHMAKEVETSGDKSPAGALKVFARSFFASRVWRLDPSGTTHWRIVQHPGRMGLAATAELFLEPDARDAMGETFNTTITFDDGSQTKLSVVAKSHTSDASKADESPSTADQTALHQALDCVVHLSDSTLLQGRLESLGAESLGIRTSWGDTIQVPLIAVRGIRFEGNSGAHAEAKFRETLSQPGASDMVLLVDREGKFVTVEGDVERLADGKLFLRHADQSRGIKVGRLFGVVFAAQPNTPQDSSFRQVLHLRSGEQFHGVCDAIEQGDLHVTTAWGSTTKLPLAEVWRITTRGGSLVYLSDLEPTAVEQVPYFGRLKSYRRDESLTGRPLKIGQETFAKGLAVHSRCRLTYALDGEFHQFKSVAGFDAEARGRGNVSLRVLADDKVVFELPSFAAEDDPAKIEVSVAGASQLTLEVGFGAREDIGDRVIWADAHLLRAKKP